MQWSTGTEWSPAARSVWAKLEADGSGWKPLTRHLEEAACTAALLWSDFVPDSVKQRIASDLVMSEDEAGRVYAFYAGVHDVGKASPDFASQAPPQSAWVLDRMRDRGLTTPTPHSVKHVRHELTSQIALRDWFMGLGATMTVANSWSSPVDAHHGRPHSGAEFNAALNEPASTGAGSGPWAEVQRELIETLARQTATEELFTTALRHGRLPLTTQMLMASLIVLADWMSSDERYFPYVDDLEPQARAAAAFDDLRIPEPWSPGDPASDATDMLHARFPQLGDVAARPLQAALVEIASTCKRPPLLIVEGPMGVGKTEAAYLAAEVLASRFGQGGVFFGLPTMATANPMFTRTLDWLENTLGDADASVALAHGKAALNDDYADLLRQPWDGQVYDEEGHGQAVVNSWLRGRRRSGLASFVVGTVDQALFAALKAKHIPLRHVALAGKVVVIDECHAADTYMRTYLKRVLTWLAAYETPVILMSATLPPAQRDEYIQAYAEGCDEWEPELADPSDIYPRITCFDTETRTIGVTPESDQTSIALRRIDDDPAETVMLLEGLLGDGGCAAVICNTVSRAQEVFRALRSRFGDDVKLLHSRFIAPDRAARERALVDELGPGSTQRPRRLIVVGTQVLEQSLDIDFDVMISDLAPADLILQRIGRLHRHSSTHRPPLVEHPQLVLRGVPDWASRPPTPDRGSRAVYGLAPLLRAATCLNRPSIQIPQDIASLVRRAYDPATPPPPGWEEAWRDADAAASVTAQAAQAHAQTYLLDPPWEPMALNGMIDVVDGDPTRDEQRGKSQVRDSEDSLEVVVLWRDTDGVLRVPRCAPRYADAVVPTETMWGPAEEGLARAIAACTLPLPRQLTNERVIDRVIAHLEKLEEASVWQSSHWLAGQLVLVFDADNSARLAGFELLYGNDGLTVREIEEHQ